MESEDDRKGEFRGLIQVQSKVGVVSSDGEAQDLMAIQKKERNKKIIKWGLIGLVIVGIILAIVLPLTLRKKPEPTPPTPPKPTPPLEYYNPYVIDKASIRILPAQTTGIIRVNSNYSAEHHSHAFKRILKKMRGINSSYGVNTSAIPVGINNPLIKNLNFSFVQNTWRVSKLTLRDNDNDRFSIPTEALRDPDFNLDMRLDMTGFKMAQDGTFDFQFSDPLIEGNQFFNTTNCTLVFMDKFIQMDFNLPSQNVYGFGERIHEFGLQEGAWNMWAQGQPSPYDDGQSGRKGVYGVHPFMLIQGKRKDDFYGIYFRNSNAQTPILTFNTNPITGEKTSKLSYITTGGQLEVYFFIHGSALDIIKKYQDVMGAKPKLPPFWSLGWMQASYKWSTQDQVEEVVRQYKLNDMPLDTVFLDIPYMDNYVDFTVNKTAFPNLTAFAGQLHQNKQQIIPIIDAGISAENLKNKYYSIGNSDNIFIKSGLYQSETYNNNLINQVWPKIAVFVDWFNPKCTNMWFEGLNDLYQTLPYDGIWIDMNEPWGFQTAELDPANPKYNPIDSKQPQTRRPRYVESAVNEESENFSWYKSFGQEQNSTWFLPFLPDFENYQSYDTNTLSLNATNPSINETQYNVHSFYGHMMARRTSEYFQNVSQNTTNPRFDKRHFILTRSTFTSTGQWASHWLGDNYREYRFMNYSIAGVMNMNMFGIPHVGADICGFFGDAVDSELCAKWAQLGTFYPFARFHYDIYSPQNEPYRQDEPFKSIIRRTMLDRYQYLRHLYTCLFDMSNSGGSCFDPLFYHFPNDAQLYQNYESSFIFAGALKVTPNLVKNTQSIPAYFPAVNGKWVSLVNTRELLAGNTTYQLDTTGFSTPVHMMPGKVMAFQNNSDGNIMNVHQLINSSMTILVNPDDNDYAEGNLFLDQGETVSELNNKNFEYYNFVFTQKSVQLLMNNDDSKPFSQTGYSVESVKILNGERFKDSNVACYLSKTDGLKPKPLTARWIEEEAALQIYSEEASPLIFSEVHSIHFANDQEFNICDMKHYQYKIANGQVPDLDNQNSVSIDLSHGPGFLPDVTVQLSIHQGDVINLKWTYKFDQSRTGKKMFKVPEEYVSSSNLPISGNLGQFVQIRASPFQLKFINDETQTEFFGIDGMVYDDYLNWVKMHVNTESGENFRGIFGLGEKASYDFFFKDGVYSLWSKDVPTPVENGQSPGKNMYGTHPFFMFKQKSNSWVGILYNLAAAQDWWIKNNAETGQVNIQTVAIGGRVDIYILMGSTPDQVVSKYFSIIGKPVLVPQWSLGWHQCRYGYRSLDTLKTVLAGYRNNNIPLDVMWSDIDYMKDYRNFIYDEDVAFHGLPTFVKDIQSQGMRYVPILDAGTSARPLPQDNYTAYQNGVEQDVFMKINGEIFIGQVWPNDAAFPDFFNPDAINWWQTNLDSMHKLLPFDGLWLDMNELSNFCGGVCYQRQAPAKSVKSQLKYFPTGRDLEKPNAVPLDVTHKNGDIQLDTHSLSGISEIKVTNEWFTKSLQRRTFIIERSSYVGMGKWASRWLGDNHSNEQNMEFSVSGTMLMNIFGIPFVGADICGFMDNTNVELCTRWHFVGAFYPFSRNHNAVDSIPQEPYVWPNSAMLAMTEAIKIKYSMVRYYYTQLYQMSLKGSGTFYKPLFFEFPEDLNATHDITLNVMLGSALKLSINSQDIYVPTTNYYFPQGLWCRIMGNTNNENCFSVGAIGITKTYPSNLTDFQLHLREGYIVPLQDTLSAQAKAFNTTKDLQNQYVDFHVLGSITDQASGKWVAHGTYINDDGEVLNITNNYNSYTLYATFDGQDTLTVLIGMDAQATKHLVKETGCYFVNQNDLLGGIFFYNAKDFKLDDKFTVTVTYQGGATNRFNAVYDPLSDRLSFDVQGAHVCMSIVQNIKIVRNKQP